MFFLLAGCEVEKNGRIAIILDNSTSMESIGTEYDAVKQAVFDSLLILPGSYESGLRVFNDGGSRLVSDYSQDLRPLQNALNTIHPSTGTYIGQSLRDAAQDLLQQPEGNHRLLLVTDGEGEQSDIDAAQEVKQQLTALQKGFKCHFILFSARADVWNETPIGKVAETLGCKVAAHDIGTMSAATLTPALLRIFGFDFYWLWIILSALVYIVLLVLTAYLVFYTQIARSVRPKVAKTIGTAFIFSLLPAVLGAHFIGLFTQLSGMIWGVTLFSLALVILAVIGFGRETKHSRRLESSDKDDPFR